MTDDVRGLLLRIVGLAALVVGAIVATAKADVWWFVTIPVTALVIAAGGIGLSVARMLRADDVAPYRPGRRSVVASSVVAVAAMVLAIALPITESAGASTARTTGGAATETVRDFLASAVLDDNAYAACQYLTPPAQERIARLAGGGQTCRDALSATQPSFAGIRSEGALHALALHAVVRDGSAHVTATPHRGRSVTFVLQRTTASEAAAYEAPPAAWRISGGATAVLAACHHGQAHRPHMGARSLTRRR
jgi:hypothetical protein